MRVGERRQHLRRCWRQPTFATRLNGPLTFRAKTSQRDRSVGTRAECEREYASWNASSRCRFRILRRQHKQKDSLSSLLLSFIITSFFPFTSLETKNPPSFTLTPSASSMTTSWSNAVSELSCTCSPKKGWSVLGAGGGRSSATGIGIAELFSQKLFASGVWLSIERKLFRNIFSMSLRSNRFHEFSGSVVVFVVIRCDVFLEMREDDIHIDPKSSWISRQAAYWMTPMDMILHSCWNSAVCLTDNAKAIWRTITLTVFQSETDRDLVASLQTAFHRISKIFFTVKGVTRPTSSSQSEQWNRRMMQQ